MARPGRLGAPLLQGLSGDDRHGLVLGRGAQQGVIAVSADAQVVTVDRLKSIAERVRPRRDRLVAVILPLGQISDRAEQLALGEDWVEDCALEARRLARGGDTL